jgi:hypothetical protein
LSCVCVFWPKNSWVFLNALEYISTALKSVLQGKKVADGLGVGVGCDSEFGEDDGRGETVELGIGIGVAVRGGVGTGVGIGAAACADDFWTRQTDFLPFCAQVKVLPPDFFTEPTFLHGSPD